MTDAMTQKPLRVSTSTAGPYLWLPFSQLDEVRRLLDSGHYANHLVDGSGRCLMEEA